MKAILKLDMHLNLGKTHILKQSGTIEAPEHALDGKKLFVQTTTTKSGGYGPKAKSESKVLIWIEGQEQNSFTNLAELQKHYHILPDNQQTPQNQNAL